MIAISHIPYTLLLLVNISSFLLLPLVCVITNTTPLFYHRLGVIQLKNMQKHTESEIPIDTLVTQLLSQGCRAVPAGADMTFLDSLHTPMN